MLLAPNHKKLLRQQLRLVDAGESTQRKKRRTARNAVSNSKKELELIEIDASTLSSDEFEDVDLELNQTPRNKVEISKLEISDPFVKAGLNLDGIEEDVDEFDDLEDVDLDQMFLNAADNSHDSLETLTFTLAAPASSDSAKNKRKRAFTPIPKEERVNRKMMHKLLLMGFMCHGAIRNRWCSDKKLMQLLKNTLPQQVVLMFHQDKENVLDVVKARKFIDGLRTVMLVYAKKFKVSFAGITRPDWKLAEITQEKSDRAVSLNRFRRLARALQGSRDIQAQGLVALLRSISVHARLVFSIQVPDHKSLRPAIEEKKLTEENVDLKESKPLSEFEPVFIPNGRLALLSGIRSKLSSELTKKSSDAQPVKFPVFWVEVWNKYSKKWITVDPAVFKVVEVQPMRRKSKFEAPMSEEGHQTWYVLAYDHRGVVRDVTRRYTQYYNAKTVKKRVGFDSDDDQHWYEQALRVVSCKSASLTEAEAYEMKEFRDRHVCEGIPNNMADFKNHPVYALESQLRQDEIIYPKDDSSKCGTFRSSNKNSTIPIYKRSHVYHLKTPKAWHMKGRVLKVGVRPLKTKPLKTGGLYAEGSDDLDDEIRLYAEFQTEMFIPPPIINGQIEKNAYGNVEIFVPTMLPENGYLARVSSTVTIKMLEKAAKYILKVDYAKAIVSFDFGNSLKSKRTPTATEGGILIDKQYREALEVVLEALEEEEENQKRIEREISALKYWNFFLKKLQIMRRLDKQHGVLASDGESLLERVAPGPEVEVDVAKNASASEEEDYYSVGSENENSENEHYVPRPSRRRQAQDRSLKAVKQGDSESYDNGGFFVDSSTDKRDISPGIEGGFLDQDEKDEKDVVSEKADLSSLNMFGEGGFLVSSSPSEVPHNNSDEQSDHTGGFFTTEDSHFEPKKEFNDSNEETDALAIVDPRGKMATNSPVMSTNSDQLQISADTTKLQIKRKPDRDNRSTKVVLTMDPNSVEEDSSSTEFESAPLGETPKEVPREISSQRKNQKAAGRLENIDYVAAVQTGIKHRPTCSPRSKTKPHHGISLSKEAASLQGEPCHAQLAHTGDAGTADQASVSQLPHMVLVSSAEDSDQPIIVLSQEKIDLQKIEAEESELGIQYSDSE
ncbi:hypothetical protein PUMCH_001583 [Australozyma saopauloensis]|uniref:DNA repair protein RAD4 n=1 Tax=Australozyma saopauloensis TaxID=291208 RepID=A0AAX4H9D5_9ASCO|nr:hypothetical protein PUMCH_001583 [[Candida] saopauloensis]